MCKFCQMVELGDFVSSTKPFRTSRSCNIGDNCGRSSDLSLKWSHPTAWPSIEISGVFFEGVVIASAAFFASQTYTWAIRFVPILSLP